MFYGISKQGGYLNRADEILREIVLPEKNKITIENFIYEHRDIILDFMSKEKEKGIEELYNYLIKNKDKISEEEYNELKKDFENSLFEAYKEGGIPDEFFREYYEKIRNLKVKKEKVKEEKNITTKRRAEEIIGAILTLVGLLGVMWNWYLGTTVEYVTHQQYCVLKEIAGWLTVIAGILLIKLK